LLGPIAVQKILGLMREHIGEDFQMGYSQFDRSDSSASSGFAYVPSKTVNILAILVRQFCVMLHGSSAEPWTYSVL
jgi:hypothetical protein